MSRRTESLALAAAVIAVGAFLLSFARGVLRDDPAATAETTVLNPVTPDPPAEPRGRIEVLNASGRRGIARLATDELRNAGFDVVFFGNAPAAAGDSSIVLDRTGNDAVARAAAQRLGIAAVRTERDSTLFVDATVILGVDWRN